MPTAALRPCSKPGCPALVPFGRCVAHAYEERRAMQHAYDQTRPSPSLRGYGRTWQKLRLMVLREEPLCAECQRMTPPRITAATDVDHIVARHKGGTNERSNLRSLCHAHHSQKTIREDGPGWRK